MDIEHHGLLTRPKADAGHKKRLRKYKGGEIKRGDLILEAPASEEIYNPGI